MEAQIKFFTAQVQSLFLERKDQQAQQDELREARRSTTVIREQRLAASEALLAGARSQGPQGADAAGDRLRPFVDFKTMVPNKFVGGTPEQFQAWACKVKNYLNAKMRSMKIIFEKVEIEEDELTPEIAPRAFIATAMMLMTSPSTCTGSSS